MLPANQFNKIAKALDNGSLKLKEISDEEYQEAEKKWRNAKAKEKGRRPQEQLLTH